MTIHSKQQNIVLDSLSCLVLVVLAMALYSVLFLHVPVLTEVRDFLIYQGWGAKLSDVFVPTGSDYRPLSWSFFAWQQRAFPYHAEAINLVQFLLLGLGALFAYIHTRQLLGKRATAFGVSALWLLSLPALHAAFWQATQHDKLAFIFVLLALITSLYAIRLDRSRRIPVFSLIITFIVAVAVSTKPVAFMLPGALLTQALLFTPEKNRAGYIRSGALIAAPVAVALLHALGYLLKMDETWRAHATSGDIETNVLVYIRSVTNIDYDGSLAIAILLSAPVVFIWARALWRWGSRALRGALSEPPSAKPQVDYDAVLIYFCAIFIGCVLVLARARHPTSFYVLVPVYVFIASIATAAISLPANRPVHVRRITTVVISALAVGLLINSSLNFTGSSRLGQWRQAAKNLADGYNVLGNRIDPERIKSISFLFPQEPIGYFYFFSDGAHQDIDPSIPSFIFRSKVSTPINDSFAGLQPQPAPGGELVVVWSDKLELVEAKVAEDSIYHNPTVQERPATYVPGTPLGFRRGENGARYRVQGWSWEETHGTWSDGDLATLVIHLDQAYQAPLELVVSGQLFVAENHPGQEIKVVANGQHIGDWVSRHGVEPVELRAAIPAEIAAQGYLNLEFHILNPGSPASLGLGPDDRMLGILLRELSIESLRPTAGEH